MNKQQLIKSDYQLTGKLYPKIDIYIVSYLGFRYKDPVYWASTCQFKTQKAFKAFIVARPAASGYVFKTYKGV